MQQVEFIAEDKIKVTFPYSAEMVNKIKEIPSSDRRFRPVGKYWVLKPTWESIEFLFNNGFQFWRPNDLIHLDNVLNEITLAETRKAQKRELSRAESAAPFEIPGIEFDPMNFQYVPIHYANVEECRFIIADEMGLGKTKQSLMLTKVQKYKTKHVLITCPKNVTYNWKEEIESAFGEKAHVITNEKEFSNPDPNIKYYICAYTRLHKIHYNFEFVICDEAHYLKNRSTVRYKEVYRLTTINTKHILLLTGTPILNRPAELYALISLLDKNFMSWSAFAKRYCGAHRGYWGWDASGATNLPELHKYLMSKIMVRRTKMQVLKQLPDKVRQTIFLDDKTVTASNVFSLFKTNADVKSANPEFLDFITNVLNSGQKVCMFAHHRAMIDALEELCAKLKIKTITITGDTHEETRQQLVNQFREDPGIIGAILSLTAAGIGTNLQTSSIVILCELYWNMGVLKQAEDRCHRIGQKDTVMVYVPVFSKFEKLTLELLLDKLKIEAQVIDGAVDLKTDDGKGSILSDLSKQLGIPIGLGKK